MQIHSLPWPQESILPWGCGASVPPFLSGMDIADIYALIVCLAFAAAFALTAVKVGGWWGVALSGLLAALSPASIRATDGAHGSGPQEVKVDTVAGRPVMTTRFPEPGGEAGAWRLTEELRLGNVSGDGPEGFGRIGDIAADPAGRIHVLDVGSKEVRVFGSDGAYLRSMVRDGDGPGEIRYRGVGGRRITWRPPGQLWITGAQQQMVVDTLGNELGRTAGRGVPGMFLAFRGEVPMTSSVIATGTDGSLFSVVNVVVMQSPDDLGVDQTYVVRSQVSADHELLPGDTLAIETRNIVEVGAGGDPRATRGGSAVSMQHVQVEDARFVWAPALDGTLWLAHRSRYRFDKLTFTGDTVLTVQVGDVPPFLTEESEFVPILAALASSPEGWLWVQREEPPNEGGSTWDILDNCGRYRATVTAPVAVRRVEVGADGVLYGISSDELGVDHVHRFRLRGERGMGVGVEGCLMSGH